MIHTFIQRFLCWIVLTILIRKFSGEYPAMSDDKYRVLPVLDEKVQCLSDKEEPVDHCRFCIHAREFLVQGRFVKSPSLAYCLQCRVTEEVNLKNVDAVKCADRQGEGFHSIANIIG
jgi:hypothetical protein